MRAAFFTLGCKVNQYETEAMSEQFRKAGYDIVKPEDTADVYVVNTCTVTNLADRKSRQYIRRAHKLNPEAVIAVTGCYAQMDRTGVEEIEGVDIIAGTDKKHGILEEVNRLVEERSQAGEDMAAGPDRDRMAEGPDVVDIKPYEDLTNYEELGLITGMEGRTRAFVKIEDGCDRFCSYCIIPYARGKVRSRSRDEIVTEVKGLVDAGYKEIVLTGINTALYGYDTGDNGIEPLMKTLNDLEGDFRIRLSSLEPQVIDAEYAVSLLKYDRLCHHLHLSAQSGSDRVLRAMNRNYTKADYLRIVESLRAKDPEYGISADIIVGFPGETDDDFRESMDLVKEALMCRTHVFKYSPRKGTKASEMEGQVPGSVKSTRSSELISLAEEVQTDFIKSCGGSTRRVLLERKENGFVTGYTDNYIKVLLPEAGEAAHEGEFIDAVIGDVRGDSAIIREI